MKIKFLSGNNLLIGVNIIGEGTTKGVITNFDSEYNLTIQDGASLVFSYTGFQSQTIEVNGQNLIDIVLAEGIELDEIVGVGYGSKKKINLTGSVATGLLLIYWAL